MRESFEVNWMSEYGEGNEHSPCCQNCGLIFYSVPPYECPDCLEPISSAMGECDGDL